ncbi:hypothetical protein LTR56_007213 [Elasticomyces elasticus]|nr:hypothetical protein LTR56_007213 [Elasticomyces elasticus]KAK3663056.1 hypothetical protein LTR22_006220 [Elasticomyces elasticus]KAK4914467.1 hypothetical protein LTR49_017272 [Elasticomyces elasticus]KAK5753467.1 hypothetical protein LTS12_016419 [Elasticomyces elasticus]
MRNWFDGSSRPSSPSRNRARKMWYSALPNLTNYKQEVKEVFLRLFQRHIPATFTIFERSNCQHKRPASYILIMAAVGGLFCSVPGSAEVARSMYNDARRLSLATYNTRRPEYGAGPTAEDKFVIVKTFLLTGLYGLCSGDKRSYEFVEACYADLTGAVLEYAEMFQNSELADDRIAQLLEALLILDSYRVIIMIRPPLSPWCALESVTECSGLGTKLTKLLSRINMGNDSDEEAPSLAVLAAIAPHVWSAMYPRQNAYAGDNVLVEAITVGQSNFAEIACERWLSTHVSGEPEASHLAVYHMMNILLHANVILLQSFAHSPPGSLARDPQRSIMAREVLRWTEDRHHSIAHWHAEQLMSVIETAVAHRMTDQHHNSARFARNQPIPDTQESPHVPYAVYFAALVLWCGGVMHEPSLTTSELRAPIVRGERVLLLHKIHVAQLLARALGGIT